ncbi:helix-turn-helix domain-containing protein [Streptomyces sp. NPDC058637]|uniref:helix-turn-helix domain-containing protein n=1 Tax=Streptomyces sp. NPDC058637 TaxID=3346569 RepID=UPI003649AE76
MPCGHRRTGRRCRPPSAFRTPRGGLTTSGAATATGLSRATARRSLLSLHQLGYADSAGSTYNPLPPGHGPRLRAAVVAHPHRHRPSAPHRTGHPAVRVGLGGRPRRRRDP